MCLRRLATLPRAGTSPAHSGSPPILVGVDASLPERITIDPAVCFGRPCIRGTRIWVSLVLGLLSDGMTVEEILADYPQLTDADVRACLDYAARVAAGRFVDVA